MEKGDLLNLFQEWERRGIKNDGRDEFNFDIL
jgi:hypothetical protein